MGILRAITPAFAIALVLSLLVLVPSVAYAQQDQSETEVIAEPSPNDIRELMRLLSDEAVRNWLVQSAEESGEMDSEIEVVGFRDQLQVGLDNVRDRIADLGQAWASLPGAPENLSNLLQARIRKSDMVRNLTYVIIFLFVGAGLEWLYRQYTTSQLLRITLQSQKSPMRRISAAATRAAIIFFGLIIFTLGSIDVFLTFQWLPIVEKTVLNFLIVVITIRTVRTISLFFLAPSVPDLRLVPLSNRSAKYFHRSALWIAGVFVFTSAAADLFSQISSDRAGNTPPETLAVLVGAAIIFVLTVLYQIWRGAKHAAKGADYTRLRRIFFWRIYLSILMVLTFLLWLIGMHAAMWSLLIVGLLSPILAVLFVWVEHFFSLATAAYATSVAEAADAERKARITADLPDEEDSEDGSEENETVPDPYDSYRPIVQRGVRFIAIITAVLLLTTVWGTNILSLSEAPTITGRVFSVLVEAIVIVLIADLIWTWARGVIDKRLANYVPPEGSEAPGPEARMATLLPLLRMTLLVTLLVTVLFSILSSLGVNIAPLLAGAGVLGIAIGFGAQSLVRDIVSGIFFLIDDAFRLGEYIEVGELRGTVESISIRSLRVRHHRGMVHTIPFGELKYLTNYSRDWVIMKLEFRVPFDTDLKLVKKLIKKVGAELLENEFYGHSILETLKSQGVRRMEEFNMVVGVKFKTKPGEQWLVRRDAYQKVRDTFEANGIRLAERNVKVEIQGGDHLDDSERKAIAAAAQQAVEAPSGPPKAIPDEP